MMKQVNIAAIAAAFVFLSLFAPTAFAATKNIYFTYDGDHAYFCNPCWVVWANSTDNGIVRTPLGASSYPFTVSGSSDYSLTAYAMQLGFNVSQDSPLELAASDTNATIMFPIQHEQDLGIVAVNHYGNFPSYNGATGGVYNAWFGMNYSWLRMKNISKAMGYERVNYYNAGGNYSGTGSVGLYALGNYDSVLVLADNDMLSASAISALQYAAGVGTHVIMSAKVANYSGMYKGSFNVSQIVFSGTHYAFRNGIAVRAGELYPDGTFTAVANTGFYDGNPNYYAEQYDNGYGVTTTTVHKLKKGIGISSAIKVVSENLPSTDRQHPLYMTLGNFYFVTSMEVITDAAPTVKALLYLSLTGFDSGEEHNIFINTYEGTDECGRLSAVSGVTCTFQGSTASSSTAGTTTVNVNTTVAAIVNPDTEARGDTTESMLFFASEADFESTSFRDRYINMGLNNQRWFAYSDLARNSQKVVFAGSKRSTTGESHYFISYNFYDTYMDTSLVLKPTSGKWFTFDDLDSSNSNELKECFGLLGICEVWTCTDSVDNNWNLTLYYGLNETAFGEKTLSCKHGSLYRTGTLGLPSIPDFDMTTVDWYYGNAPNFPEFDTEIGENDTVPVKLLQANKQDVTHNWIRQFVVYRFNTQDIAGQGGTTDTGGYIDMKNAKLYFKYLKPTGGNMTLTGSGTGELSCIAPDGYAFLAEDGTFTSYYKKNITVTSDLSLGVRLQQSRPLRLSVHVTSSTMEDIDGARCSINGFNDVFSTNGYCVFGGVQPNTEYAVHVVTSGAEALSTDISVTTGDYYDSGDMEPNGEQCGIFDGTFYIEAEMDGISGIRFTALVRVDDGGETNVMNAKVRYKNMTCRTDNLGKCVLTLPINYNTGYAFNITKEGYILPYYKVLEGRGDMQCSKSDACSYTFYVNQDPEADDVNGDGIVDVFSGEAFTGEGIVLLMIKVVTSPIALGLFLIAFCTFILGTHLGLSGALIGSTIGVIFTITFGLIPLAYGVAFFLVIALIFALVLKSGVIGGG